MMDPTTLFLLKYIGSVSKPPLVIAIMLWYVCSRKKDSTTGLQRMRTCISAIYDHATRIWKARNEVLHSKDDDEQMYISSTEIAEIKALYRQPHCLLQTCDHHDCERSMGSLINGSFSLRRRWLRRVRKSNAENDLDDGGRQSLITHYFAQKTGKDESTRPRIKLSTY